MTTQAKRDRQKGRVPDSDGVVHRPRSAHEHVQGKTCRRCRPDRQVHHGRDMMVLKGIEHRPGGLRMIWGKGTRGVVYDEPGSAGDQR